MLVEAKAADLDGFGISISTTELCVAQTSCVGIPQAREAKRQPFA